MDVDKKVNIEVCDNPLLRAPQCAAACFLSGLMFSPAPPAVCQFVELKGAVMF
jgi:hypothetical protein